MENDFTIENFTPPMHPNGIELTGKTVRLEPLNALKHAEDLFQSNSFDRDGVNGKHYASQLEGELNIDKLQSRRKKN